MGKAKDGKIIVAVFALVSLLLAIPIVGIISAQAVDVSKACSLDINAGDFDDLKNAKIIVDLYKVADAVRNNESYSYHLSAGYDIKNAPGDYDNASKYTDDEWESLAQQAATSVLSSGQSFAPEQNHNKLSCGLYLVVAHGEGIENYVVKDDDNGEITTVAYSDKYVYSFLPELISVPGRDVNKPNGAWIYNRKATLKPRQDIRFGDLRIEKDLKSYEETSPATFVFQIEATLRGETVFSDVVGLTFTGPEKRVAYIKDRIPVGSSVTVREVYGGSSYEATGKDVKFCTILNPADKKAPASVSFENEYNNKQKTGYGIINHFSYTDESFWVNDNSGDNAEGDGVNEQ